MIDPKLKYCTCGRSWKPGLYHKIMMLIFHEYTWTCPSCHTRLKFKLIYHVVKVETKKVDKKELWKRG